jgi:PTH1 family peptidyl-tRNA hydrolase
MDYAHTRHNAGYQVVDAFSLRHRIRLFWPRFHSRIAFARIAGEKVLILKPRTFMNLSGKAIAPALHHYHLSLQDLIVIHDDLDLPVGTLRFSRKGGDGGHRGIRSIIEALGTGEFLRLRVGIGRPPENEDVVDYVLSPPSQDERENFENTVQLASQALDVMLEKGLPAAMTQFHRSR